MKKLFVIWFLSIFSLSLFGCGSMNNEIDTQSDVISTGENISQENVDDILNDEKLLSFYPELWEWFDWTVILWDMLQTNYINSTDSIYYDPYRWIALKLWAEFDGWMIREIDTDEGWIPHSEIIFLIKWDENEENRTGINWYREIFSITAVSKENLENFWASLDDIRGSAFIWENNQYYFIDIKSDLFNNSYSDLIVFDVE